MPEPGGPVQPGAPRGVGDVLISAQPLGEYLAMFDLGVPELRGLSVLDCPSGAGSTGAELHALGVRVVSADPAYALEDGELVRLARASVDRGNAYVAAHPDRYVWGFIDSVEEHHAQRSGALERFVADHAVRPGAYVAASLPRLPFADGTFDLVLSAHLLFSYPDHFDEPAHLAMALELARVSRREVRVFPLVDSEAVPYPALGELRSALSVRGVESEVRRVPYEFQRGGDRMLVCERRRT